MSIEQKARESNIKIGIQKSGRLTSETVSLLKKAGLEFDLFSESNILSVLCRNFEAELYFLRDEDIRRYVAEQKIDLGVIGQNLLYEYGTESISQLLELGFAKCSLTIAVPEDAPYKTINDLEGKKIATSYLKSTQRFFEKHAVKPSIILMQGSVEIAPKLGYADAISDLVSSGNTLRANGLRPLAEIYSSQAVLVGNPRLPNHKSERVEELIVRARAVIDAAKYKYLVMNAPIQSIDEISRIAPGLKSPTVIPLARDGWVSVHVIIKETDFWDTIKALRKLGVSGIAEIPIERIIF